MSALGYALCLTGITRHLLMKQSYFEEISSINSLTLAHKAAKKGKGKNRECILFDLSASENIYRLHKSLTDGTYRIGGYYSFNICDPKPRTVNALRYADRVVQHSLCDFGLRPIIEPHLIYDNAANRIGKGTDFARRRLKQFMSSAQRKWGGSFYYVKLDVHHYFDSINHNLLKKSLERVVDDERLMALVNTVIDSFESAPGVGLPLGNQSSQWFGIYYLDHLDRVAKEKLRIRFYIRYMDDVIILGDCKEQCIVWLDFLKETLKGLELAVNPKSGVFSVKRGIDFLGFRYRLSPSGGIVVTVSKRVRKRIKKANSRESIVSYVGYLKNSNSKQIVHILKQKYKTSRF